MQALVFGLAVALMVVPALAESVGAEPALDGGEVWFHYLVRNATEEAGDLARSVALLRECAPAARQHHQLACISHKLPAGAAQLR